MPPIVFLALLTILMLVLAALRLELNFRRTAADGPAIERTNPGPKPRDKPELRTSPAGGYCQSPWRAGALKKR